MMHTEIPPSKTIEDWLEDHPGFKGNFGHLLLLQKEGIDTELLSQALRPYFESAHLDARTVFHADMGIDLHPDAGDGEAVTVTYPNSLSLTAHKGLFGEVMAGLITEHYELVGQHDWVIPIFLFRHHEDARNYLFELARNGKERQTIGRLGTDFIGIELADDGSVVRLISGEAKWRQTLSRSVVETLMLGGFKKEKNEAGERERTGKGVWDKVNNEPSVPVGLRQLQRLLQEHAKVEYEAAILSMDRALLLRNTDRIPKTDLVVIVGNGAPKREKMGCLLPFEGVPPEYTAGNDLQLVEVILRNGEDLIEHLYQSLWMQG